MTTERFPKTLSSDLPASFVVMLVALPLCLGIALASGAPLISGLIAGVLGGIVVGSLSGSQLGVSGPAAGLAAIVLVAIQELGAFEIFLVAVVLGGGLQLLLGFLKAGVIAYYFPSSVIKGMLAGIGVIIILKQIPHAFGWDKDPVGELAFNQPDGETTFSEISHVFEGISWGPTSIALVSMMILLLWETKAVKNIKASSILPGPLVAVAVSVVMNVLFKGNESLALGDSQVVAIPVARDMESFKSFFAFPAFADGLSNPAVYKTAFVLAIVASLETLLCVEAADKLDPQKRITPTNRELKAQGVGNLISGMIGGLPITQVIVRSSANAQSGAKTKASAIMHGILLAICIVAIPTLMNLIPLATLAAILFVVGYKLAKPAIFKAMWKQGVSQFLPFVVTVVAIALTDLLTGIGLGLAVAIVMILMDSYRLPVKVEKTQEGGTDTTKIELPQQVTFLNKASVLGTLDAVPSNSKVEVDGTKSIFVHPDVIEIVGDFVVGADNKNIEVSVRGLDLGDKAPAKVGSH